MDVTDLYAPPQSSLASAPPAPLTPEGSYTASEILREGYRTFREQPGRLMGLHAVGLGALYGSSFLVEVAFRAMFGAQPAHNAAWISGARFGCSFVLSTFFAIGLNRVSLAAVRGRRLTLGLLFEGIDVLFPAMAASLLTTFLVTVGTLALVVPGILAAVALSFAPLLVADRRAGGFEAIAASLRLSRGVRWRLFALGILSCLVLMGGALMLGVGFFAAYPITTLALAHAYVRRVDQGPTSHADPSSGAGVLMSTAA